MGVSKPEARVHARPVRQQCFALGLALGLLFWRLVCCLLVFDECTGLQSSQLRLRAGLTGGQCFLEDGALLGVHAFSLGPNLQRFEPCDWECDAIYNGVAPFDGLRMCV